MAVRYLRFIASKKPLTFCERFFKRPEALAELAKQRRRPDLCEQRRTYKKQQSLSFQTGFELKKGDDILSHITAVPSAQAGLTSLFGMGRGEPRRNNHLRALRDRIIDHIILLTNWDRKIIVILKAKSLKELESFLPHLLGAEEGRT